MKKIKKTILALLITGVVTLGFASPSFAAYQLPNAEVLLGTYNQGPSTWYSERCMATSSEMTIRIDTTDGSVNVYEQRLVNGVWKDMGTVSHVITGSSRFTVDTSYGELYRLKVIIPYLGGNASGQVWCY
ncbi:hypothetical protein [Ornithinibacillus contaminans]|uniref:hypothetical protein n=1 Tax=Ornithinibacillus contaminans TaxID=694055 RepID=UPI00064D9080|nr:hypothetical protein [Ornithinibacillus contaminans]